MSSLPNDAEPVKEAPPASTRTRKGIEVVNETAKARQGIGCDSLHNNLWDSSLHKDGSYTDSPYKHSPYKHSSYNAACDTHVQTTHRA